MRILAISRWEMEDLVATVSDLTERACIISINDPGEQSPVPADAENVLTLHFHDIDSPVPGEEDKYVLFSREQALEVVAFLRRIGKKHLVVHCAMGVSRSGAVAQFAHEMLGSNARHFAERNAHIDPNPHVLRLLRDCL
jgi:predicted protein tyrosine phosphatase